MKKIIFALLLILLLVPPTYSQVVGADPQTRYRDTSYTLPDGLWRWRFNGNATLEYNTASAGDFSGITTAVTITTAGALWVGGGNETSLWGVGAGTFLYRNTTADVDYNTIIDTNFNPAANASGSIQTIMQLSVPAGNTRNISNLTALNNYVTAAGSGVLTTVRGQYGEAIIGGTHTATNVYAGYFLSVGSGTSGTTNMYAVDGFVQLTNTATVTNAYAVKADSTVKAAGATVTNNYGFYAGAQDVGTNNYAYWYNGTNSGAGVWRVNGLGIEAYYNPSFATYTPGAANYERIVTQWTSDVAEIGTEAGGTGTLRSLRLLGNGVNLTELASDPAAPAANSVTFYSKDNGSNKTTLCARFATGGVQCFATEP